jgi:hypothetical protein
MAYRDDQVGTGRVGQLSRQNTRGRPGLKGRQLAHLDPEDTGDDRRRLTGPNQRALQDRYRFIQPSTQAPGRPTGPFGTALGQAPLGVSHPPLGSVLCDAVAEQHTIVTYCHGQRRLLPLF